MRKKAKVLFIEDDPILVEACLARFAQEKFETLVAIDGEEGLAKIEKERPDLILLDLILPKLDGFKLLEKIKKDPKTASIPVIILSNLGQDEEIKRGMALGAVSYLLKAICSLEEIVEKIKNQLKSL